MPNTACVRAPSPPPIPNPFTPILSVAEAITTGDVQKIQRSVGEALIASTVCLGCVSVAQTVLPQMTANQMQDAVGRGFFVFLATGDPVLVTVDAATNIATQQDVRPDIQRLPGPVIAPALTRASKTYTASADCIVTGGGQVYAGWKRPPTLTDHSGASYVYPNVDLQRGDTIKVTAPICPGWQNSVQSAAWGFQSESTKVGDAKVVKYFLIGSLAPMIR